MSNLLMEMDTFPEGYTQGQLVDEGTKAYIAARKPQDGQPGMDHAQALVAARKQIADGLYPSLLEEAQRLYQEGKTDALAKLHGRSTPAVKAVIEQAMADISRNADPTPQAAVDGPHPPADEQEPRRPFMQTNTPGYWEENLLDPLGALGRQMDATGGRTRLEEEERARQGFGL